MKKFKEFWIWGFKIGDDESISQNCSVHLDKGGSEFFEPVHHVIEYSAVEEARNIAEVAQSELLSARKEIKELQEKLHKAIESLEFYGKTTTWDHHNENRKLDWGRNVMPITDCCHVDNDEWCLYAGKKARETLKEIKG